MVNYFVLQESILNCANVCKCLNNISHDLPLIYYEYDRLQAVQILTKSSCVVQLLTTLLKKKIMGPNPLYPFLIPSLYGKYIRGNIRFPIWRQIFFSGYAHCEMGSFLFSSRNDPEILIPKPGWDIQ